jgi:hypothetical protein
MTLTQYTIEMKFEDGQFRYLAKHKSLSYTFATNVQLSNDELDKFLQYKINQIK